MTTPLAALFTLAETGPESFHGPVLAEKWPSIYGGLLLGQAAAAAGRTVAADRALHSLHAYFVRRGDPTQPVHYTVQRGTETRRFSLRRVLASQSGETLLDLTASYHAPEPGWHHAATLPDVPGPDALEPDRDHVFKQIQELPPALGDPHYLMRGVEYRMVPHPLPSPNGTPTRALWFRVTEPLPADPRLHEALLAHISDFSLIGAALATHRGKPAWTGIGGASLDHSLWLHQTPRCDQWLLYAQDSPWAGTARGFARGQIFDPSHGLIASTAQEGLIRPNPGWTG